MLESIIFHFIFVIFIVWAFVWWLFTKKKHDAFKNALIPALLRNKIQFPQDRSLVVRSLVCLQEELSAFFQCKVQIQVQFKNLSLQLPKNFLFPLCYLIWQGEIESSKYFTIDGVEYSSQEFVSYVKLKGNLKNFNLKYDFSKNIWNVELYYAS